MGEDGWEYLKELNPPQREAVLHRGEPLLILAGAGSGKTRVITVKLAHLISREGVNPKSILAVTFTNKAAQEMKERARKLCPAAEGVLIRTFHSFCAWFLRRNGSLVGLQPQFSIYDEEDSLSLLHSLYPDWEKKHLAPLAFAISRAKDYGLYPEDSLYRISNLPEFPEMYRRYNERLRQIGSVDFGDLILRTLEILRQFPEVKQRVQDRFQVLLVDEYQDSNVVQHQLLKEMYRPGNYICVVGDDDQSIYRFRGAEVGNLLAFPEEFPGTRIIRLEQNYRSTEKILHAASEVVKKNRGRLGKTLWTDRKGGADPVILPCMDPEEEARLCVSLIRKAPLKETAILYRINAQSRVFERVLLQERVPYRLVGAVRFYEREEVKDVIAYLRFLLNPRDEVSFRRIVNKPSRGLGDATVEAVLSHPESATENILVALERERALRKGKKGEPIQAFLSLYQELSKKLEGSALSKFVELLIRESGLEEYYQNQDRLGGTHKLQNLEEMVNAAAEYPKGVEGLARFLEEIQLDASRVSNDRSYENHGEQGAVTLITMHNTKGLEFDRVIVTGMEEGLFPRAEEESPEELEEERRLFYVAITRAKEEVYFTYCRLRTLHGQTREVEPSRFLRELPPSVWESSKPYVGRFDAERGNGGTRVAMYAPGTLVYHEEYGQGMVMRQWEKEGQLVVMVRFESGRTAQFLPKYDKRLERVSRDG